jgi:hypothetical protein
MAIFHSYVSLPEGKSHFSVVNHPLADATRQVTRFRL